MRIIVCSSLLLLCCLSGTAQGCSDAGFCTAGNFNAIHYDSTAIKTARPLNEIDIALNYSAHLQYERFYQPQINYRRIKTNGAYFELRLPLNIATNTASKVTNTGIGDIIATYNGKFTKKKNNKCSYSTGLRISFSDAAKKEDNSNISLPMYLQNGLGTTDIIGVINYDIIKYFSLATGIQYPILQYNKHKIYFVDPANSALTIGENYRRKPDALLKATGHYQKNRFKGNAGVLGIFHLANDYYETAKGKFILENSKGTTLNWTADISYASGKKLMLSLLYAEPFKTRSVIPDGLARSRIISPKLTYSF